MSDEVNDMLSPGGKDVSDEQLLAYLQNKLPAEETHDLEKEMLNSPFVSDAIDGLAEFKNKPNLLKIADQLNGDLHKHLRKKKKNKRSNILSRNQPVVLLAIIITIALIILAYMVIIRHIR